MEILVFKFRCILIWRFFHGVLFKVKFQVTLAIWTELCLTVCKY